jgi:hypothetical protein
MNWASWEAYEDIHDKELLAKFAHPSDPPPKLQGPRGAPVEGYLRQLLDAKTVDGVEYSTDAVAVECAGNFTHVLTLLALSISILTC